MRKKEGQEEVGICEDLQHVKAISAAPGRHLQTPELYRCIPMMRSSPFDANVANASFSFTSEGRAL